MKKSTTKRALFMSFVSMFLCFTMLLGTTYAWFTDSVTSGVNTIVAGNLDVELYNDVVVNDNKKVTENTDLFDGIELWEPGAAVYENFTVANVGNLALKYEFSVVIANADGFNSFADALKVGVVDGGIDATTATRETAIAAVDEWMPFASFAETGKLEANDNDTYGVVVYWEPSDNDNAFNMNNGNAGKQLKVNIGVNLFATQVEAEFDSFGDDYDAAAMTFVTTAEEAQAALDNAVSGTTIKLAPGYYGTLAFRQNASKTVVDITDMGGDAAGNEKYSAYEDITILGVEGAVVDQIDFQVGWLGNSGASFVDVKNLTIKGVTFSGEKNAINLEGSKGSALGIDGLTLVDCKMNDADGNNRLVFQQITGYKVLNDKSTGEYVMTAGVKNLTITNCEVAGAYMVIESRAMENLTITNNVFKGIKERDMLITSDTTNYPNVTYTGAITVTGNTSSEGEERFVRASLNNSDAVVVIKDNVINNYMGADDDYIKVTDGNNVTIENNPMTRAYKVSNTAEAQAALDNVTSGATIMLAPNVNYGTLYLRPTTNNPATKSVDWIGNNYGYESYSLFENLTIVGAEGATVDAIEIEGGTYYHTEHSQAATYPVMLSLVELKNVVIDGVTFTGNGGYDPQGYGNVINLSGANIKVDGLTLKNCVLENPANNARLIYKTESTTHVHNYAYDGQTYTFVPSLKDITITDCTFNGGYMGLELRETENVTITNNVFNVADRNILLPVNSGYTYSGTVTITGNVSNNAQERFVRADGMGDAVVVITNNTLNNYAGADVDYIKVTNANNVTIENNTKN